MRTIFLLSILGALLSYSSLAQTQSSTSPTLQLNKKIDQLCGIDDFQEVFERAPDGEAVQRYTGCGAARSTCFSNCTPFIPLCKYKVPVVFTIITDGNGTTNLGSTSDQIMASINSSLARCNNYYAGAGIEFVHCQSPRNLDGTDPNFNSGDLYDFSNQSSDSDDAAVEVFDLNNVINIYLVGDLTSSSGGGLCGYAFQPGMFSSGTSYDQNLRSVIDNACFVGDNTTLEHELGHFFALEHTHNGASGSVPNEAADGTDACLYTFFNGTSYTSQIPEADIGDGVADTSPDPNLGSGAVSNQCVYTGSYTPDPTQPLPLSNIMSYSNDFYCHKMNFTPCQLERIQEILLNCRNILFCTSAYPDVEEINMNVCLGTQAPTFMAKSDCYSWYSTQSGGTALESSSQYFTPPLTPTELSTPGTYTYYVEYDNEIYDVNFSGTFHDTFGGNAVSPDYSRKAVSVTVLGGACNSFPGNGVSPCVSMNCGDICNFDTDGATFSGPFSMADYKTGWAITSGPNSTIKNQSDLDALPSGQLSGSFDVSTPAYNYENTCTNGVPNLAVGTYSASPFISKNPSAAAMQTFSSTGLSRALLSSTITSEGITVADIPESATVAQVCVTLDYGYSGALSIYLGGPNGNDQVMLVNRVGFPNTRPWGNSNDYDGTYCFEVGANAFPQNTTGDIPSGTYEPEDIDFASVNNSNPNGEWSLFIDVLFGGSSGTLTAWEITFDVPEVTFPTMDRLVEGAVGNAIEFEVLMGLPVELINFYGKKQDEQVKLSWETSSEENNSHFILQKSRDAVYFENMTEIPGAGTSNLSHNYEYVDKNPFNGMNYYRLITQDYEGRMEASEVIPIQFDADDDLSIYPNPVIDNQLTLKGELLKGATAIEIRSMDGKLIQFENIVLETSQHNLTLNNMSKGIYYILIKTDHEIHSQKFVKQ